MSNFRVRIHRGTQQIGGTCIELEAQGQRIVLDLGLPLDAKEASEALLPKIPGLKFSDPTLNAIAMGMGTIGA